LPRLITRRGSFLRLLSASLYGEEMILFEPATCRIYAAMDSWLCCGLFFGIELAIVLCEFAFSYSGYFNMDDESPRQSVCMRAAASSNCSRIL
jgi:hypothetical protein